MTAGAHEAAGRAVLLRRHLLGGGCIYSMAAFQPSAEGLNQLLTLFKASQSATNAQHRAIQQQLNDFNVIPGDNS